MNYQKRGKVRAVQIGCVSRGAGCAAFNSPAIYTSVKNIYDWIKKTVTDNANTSNYCRK